MAAGKKDWHAEREKILALSRFELMTHSIGIRREDKNRWETRAPLIPDHVRELKQANSIDVLVQPSSIRCFSDSEYRQVGALLQEDLSTCSVVFAIKEIPAGLFQPGKTYVFFSHTIKGQPYNMPMLRRLIELKCHLIDYERVVDGSGRRLLFFGRYAGLAGMIDTLWALGRRLDWEGLQSPFAEFKQTYQYGSLEEAVREIGAIGEAIKEHGLPQSLAPLIIGIAGYGNVSQGAQEILDIMPVQEIGPEEIERVAKSGAESASTIYKVVFKEEDMVEPVSPEHAFGLEDYYSHPEKYRSRFHNYLTHLTLLVNAVYWDSRYPRLVTKQYLRDMFSDAAPRLRVIGDISCDIQGAIECTLRHTDPENPVFVYDPSNNATKDGWEGTGVVVLAVDNLPCEIPKESSTDFSWVLKPYVPEIAGADFSADFKSCELSPAIKDAVILYHGELTPNYRYLEKMLTR